MEAHLAPAMAPLNLSATVNILRAFKNPSLLCPHHTIATFAELPIPLSRAFRTAAGNEPDIRAVILDKDNCFARPHALDIHPAYNVTYFHSSFALSSRPTTTTTTTSIFHV